MTCVYAKRHHTPIRALVPLCRPLTPSPLLRIIITTTTMITTVVITAIITTIVITAIIITIVITAIIITTTTIIIPKAGFEALMARDRAISEAAERARRGGSSKDMTLAADQTTYLADQKVPITESNTKYTRDPALSTRILAIFNGRSADGLAENAGFLSSASTDNDVVGVVVGTTSYYYESGGQIYDTGVMTGSSDGAPFEFAVSNVQTYAGYVVHIGCLTEGSIAVGTDTVLTVDYERRDKVAPNHTMTHVLNHALREVLTKSDPSAAIDQKGSLVDDCKLRFDFSWGKALSTQQSAEVEDLVNKCIQASHPVYAEVVPLKDATEISALRAVFGERYPDPVRVISVGADISELLSNPKDAKWGQFSIEFCGGTHLGNTGDAAAFALVEQSPVAKGVRRIVAFTGDAAVSANAKADRLQAEASGLVSLVGGGILAGLGASPAAIALAATVSESLKQLKLNVDASQLSVVRKVRIQETMEQASVDVRAFNKRMSAAKTEAALSAITDLGDFVNANATCAVAMNADIQGDAKLAGQLTKKFDSLYKESSLFLVSFDAEKNKLGCFTLCSKTHQGTGLDGKLWCVAGMDAAGGGKGGGKPAGGMGFVVDARAADADAVLQAAAAFAASKGVTLHMK